VPGDAFCIPLRDTVVDGEPVVNGLLLNDMVAPPGNAGTDAALRLMLPVNDPTYVAVRFPEVIGLGAGHVAITAAGLLNVNPLTGAVTLKLLLEISKNIFPNASTLIRAVEVTPTGIVTDSEPSLAVLANKTVGNVKPPSLEKSILTFDTLKGAALVPTTFQVTVWVDPPA